MLRLRFDDFTRATRSHTLAHATAQTPPLLATARALLAAEAHRIELCGLSLVGISVGNLADDGVVQLALPFDRRHDTRIDAAIDEVRDRFGNDAVTSALLVGRERGIEMPMLPD
jgi:DNA polymerase-4